MNDQKLDTLVVSAVSAAEATKMPINYAMGPLADRRVSTAFRQFGIRAPKDRLCASINRLVARGVIDKQPTGEKIAGCGSCTVKYYPVVELVMP